MYSTDLGSALQDFRSARQKAALERLGAQLTGRSSRMLEYDKVRRQLHGLESARTVLKDIPLDSIVGTVGRYNDFTRKLLPLNNADSYRWARVKSAVESAEGVPAIDVYQIGSAYFILDGHHRASIARDMGATHIQANVREVVTKVPITPEIDPDGLIIKAEYTDFLNQTHLDTLVPEANLDVTVPGAYAKLFEHIQVHKYFMGLDFRRNITDEEAVRHWYSTVYHPVASVIRNRHLLQDFPGRTVADLYLWIMDHQSQLENELGSPVSTIRAAEDIAGRSGSNLIKRIKSAWKNLQFIQNSQIISLLPRPGEAPPIDPHEFSASTGVFETILVGVTGDESGWRAVRYAARVAHEEGSFLTGLHINNSTDEPQPIRERFDQICQEEQIRYRFITQAGKVTTGLFAHGRYSDLLVLRLSFPPPLVWFRRFGSGMRTLIRNLESPLVVVPPDASLSSQRIVLGFGPGRMASEALFLSTYLTGRWSSDLKVVIAEHRGIDSHELQEYAQNYLANHGLGTATVEIIRDSAPASAILNKAQAHNANLIVMGGYEGGYFREILMGSAVDQVLQKTTCAVLICN